MQTDPDLFARLKARFSRQAFLNTLGAELQTIQPGLAEISLPFDPRFTQQDGFLHAGVVTTLVDTACGYAAFTLMPPHSRVLTVEFKVNFIAPAAGEHFLARGTVIRPGKTITVCDGNVFAYRGQQEKLVAVMQATMIRVSQAEASQAGM